MQTDLRSIMHEILKPYGFRRRSSTWHLKHPDSTAVINLQRSQWSTLYYINLGIDFDRLGDGDEFPKEHRCQLRRRLPVLSPEGQDALDLKNGMAEEQRREHLERQIVDDAVPWLLACSTTEGVKNLLNTGTVKEHEMTLILRKALEA